MNMLIIKSMKYIFLIKFIIITSDIETPLSGLKIKGRFIVQLGSMY